MDQKTKEQIIDIEFALIAKLRPIFLAISTPLEEDDDLEIVIGCSQFSNKTIQERVSIVFKLISEYRGDILDERLIVVQTFSSSELDNVLDDIFSQELFWN